LSAEFPIRRVADQTLTLYRALLRSEGPAATRRATRGIPAARPDNAGRDVAGEQGEGLPGPPAT
ncbi:MAG TPA: hypothetical protein PLO65_12785, partial [Caulobacter sp.]|nr:hypothetical protein [Caulobacter sp.]